MLDYTLIKKEQKGYRLLWFTDQDGDKKQKQVAKSYITTTWHIKTN